MYSWDIFHTAALSKFHVKGACVKGSTAWIKNKNL